MEWEEVMWNRSELYGMGRSHVEQELVSCMEWEEVMWNRSKLYGMGRNQVEHE